MPDSKFEPKLLTFVSDSDMNSQFEAFGDLVVQDARLLAEIFDTIVFNVNIQVGQDMLPGQIGALLLWINEFGFQYLGKCSKNFRKEPTEPLEVICDDVTNHFIADSAKKFSAVVASNCEELEFFMDDEDHRYMSFQVAENWRQPDVIRVRMEVIGVDGAYGTFKKKGELFYEESLPNWKLTNPKNVVLEDYEKRLRHQATQNF